MSDSQDDMAPTRVLRQQISARLADLEGMLGDLRRHEAAARRARDDLRTHDHRLQDLEVNAELLHARWRDAEKRCDNALAERRRAERELDEVTKDRDRLAARCEELARALEQARSQNHAAQQEISCLEAQVEQLQSIADLLLRREDS